MPHVPEKPSDRYAFRPIVTAWAPVPTVPGVATHPEPVAASDLDSDPGFVPSPGVLQSLRRCREIAVAEEIGHHVGEASGLRVMAKRKSKERRSELRVELDRATVRLEGRVYPLKNWSEHGALAGSYGGELKVGDKVEVRLSVPFVGVAREFSGLARVVRVDQGRAEIAGHMEVVGEEWSSDALDAYFRRDWEK